MSVVAVRAALETALGTIAPALATAYENVSFVPPAASVPYQRAFVKFAEPENSETGDAYFEHGYLQVTLCYPRQAGTGAVGARGDLIRTKFRRSSSFVSGGVVVTITRTPSIVDGLDDGVMYTSHVKIPFHAFIN